LALERNCGNAQEKVMRKRNVSTRMTAEIEPNIGIVGELYLDMSRLHLPRIGAGTFGTYYPIVRLVISNEQIGHPREKGELDRG
jgi:hypothetical protein